MKFWVNVNSTYKEVAVDFIAESITGKFSALIVEGTKVHFNISSFEIGAIKIISTTFGNLYLDLVTELLNKGIEFGLPDFNVWMSTLKV